MDSAQTISSGTDQTAWSNLSTKERCRVIGQVAHRVCDHAERLIADCQSDQRTDAVETITSELMPLCAALDWIRKRGHNVLSERKVGVSGRPLWMPGVHSVVQRVPLGEVLILGTWNYPLLLPGVQIAQALAAGNRVLLKPAIGTEQASQTLAKCFYQAGVPESQFAVLGAETSHATEAIQKGVDLIVLTGAAETGRKVLAAAAETLTPTIMELSGSDSVIVLPGCDLERVTKCLLFGIRFNAGATCIAPRRLIVQESEKVQIVAKLLDALKDLPPLIVHPAARAGVAECLADAIEEGAVDLLGQFDRQALVQDGRMVPCILDNVQATNRVANSDLFAPVLSIITVGSSEEAVQIVNESEYRLASSVFGPAREADAVANQLNVGTVTVNDLITPTADPRLPFGGRGKSGFGVTRGPEGLLSMSAVRVISRRKGSLLPHLFARKPSDQEMLHGSLELLHGKGVGQRLAGLRRSMRSVKKK